MTRELKLTLVIGVALLLLLAIIASDHFSTADGPQDTLHESSQPRGVLAQAPPPAIREARPTPPPAPAAAVATGGIVEIGPAASREVVPTGSRVVVPPAPAIPAATPASRETAVAEVPIYRVKEGDSLSRIALEAYGDRDLWKALAAHNTDRLRNPNVLKAGLVLRLPPREVLVGGTVRANDPLAGAAPPPRPSTARTHVVREGETLSEIAAATLGSSRRWPELVAANSDRIDDPDRVMPGTELRIPSSSSR